MRLEGLAHGKNLGRMQSVLTVRLCCLISPRGYETCLLFYLSHDGYPRFGSQDPDTPRPL